MIVAFGIAVVLTVALTTYFSRTFTGRAIKAVGQDEGALRLMGANPVKIKQLAFGIATGVNALAGAMLIIVGPVEPMLDRVYIGRTFCVVVLAGLGELPLKVTIGTYDRIRAQMAQQDAEAAQKAENPPAPE